MWVYTCIGLHQSSLFSQRSSDDSDDDLEKHSTWHPDQQDTFDVDISLTERCASSSWQHLVCTSLPTSYFRNGLIVKTINIFYYFAVKCNYDKCK